MFLLSIVLNTGFSPITGFYLYVEGPVALAVLLDEVQQRPNAIELNTSDWEWLVTDVSQELKTAYN